MGMAPRFPTTRLTHHHFLVGVSPTPENAPRHFIPPQTLGEFFMELPEPGQQIRRKGASVLKDSQVDLLGQVEKRSVLFG